MNNCWCEEVNMSTNNCWCKEVKHAELYVTKDSKGDEQNELCMLNTDGMQHMKQVKGLHTANQ